MTKDFCDRCGKEMNGSFYRLSIEVSPAKFHRKHRDYCEPCFNEVAGKLDEKLTLSNKKEVALCKELR